MHPPQGLFKDGKPAGAGTRTTREGKVIRYGGGGGDGWVRKGGTSKGRGKSNRKGKGKDKEGGACTGNGNRLAGAGSGGIAAPGAVTEAE